MATSSERLAVLIEANTRSYENAMKRIEQKTDQAIRASERSVKRLDKSLQTSASSAAVFARSFIGAFATIQTGQALARAADTFTRLENSLKVTGLQGEALKKRLGELEAVAKRQAAPIEEIVRLYSRMATVQKDLGVSTDDMLAVTEGVAAALKIQGTSADQARGSLIQLAQAFGGGIVRAEEFNSVLEGTPVLAQAIANNLAAAGGSIGKLRQLVVDGKVSSQEFFRAIRAGSGDLRQTASTMDQTVGQALENMRSAFILAVGEFDNLTGASGRIVTALEAVATAMRNIGAGADWTMDRVRELQRFLISTGLIDVEARNRLSASGPGSMVRQFADEALRRQIDEAKAQAQAITEQIEQINYNIVHGFINEGHIDAARKEVERLREEFRLVNEEIVSLTRQYGNLGSASITVPPYLQRGIVPDTSSAPAPTSTAMLPTGAVPIDTARQFIGLQESRDADILSNLFKQAGQNVDPKMVAWCAAFVNAVLATSGTTGTGSLAAKSFLDYGQAVPEGQQQVGDIVVLSRDGGGHVGFFEGMSATGNVRVLGGNQGNEVSVDEFDPSRVLGYRRVPGAGAASTSGNAIADEIAARNDAAAQAAEDAAQAAEDARQKQEELDQATADFEKTLARQGQALDLQAQSLRASTAEQEYLAEKQRLTNELMDAGIPITAEYAAKIEELAQRSAALVVAGEQRDLELERQQESMDAAIARADAVRGLASDVIGGLATDLANGVKPAEALANALGKIAQKLIDIGTNALVSSLFGPQGTQLGGIFGSLFGGASISSQASAAISGGVLGGIFHQGGVVGASSVPARMVPAAMFHGAPRYHSGGIAGLQPGEVPIIAQQGETIIPRGGNRSLGQMRSASRQRVDVDNVVHIRPSPEFEAKVDQRVRQGQAETLAAVPGYLGQRQRRGMQ